MPPVGSSGPNAGEHWGVVGANGSAAATSILSSHLGIRRLRAAATQEISLGAEQILLIPTINPMGTGRSCTIVLLN